MNDLDTQKITYDLLMVLAGQNTLKRRIIITLAHLYPKAVSAAQLTKLLGFSGKAGSRYRGVLDHLVNDQFILVDELTPKLKSIRINHQNRLMQHLLELCQKHGEKTQRMFDQSIIEG